MTDTLTHLINGESVSSGAAGESVNPSDLDDVVARYPKGGEAEVNDAVVGAGTLLTPADFDAAQRAGARFAVSPGLTPALLAAGADSALPYLPGSATVGEAMLALENGYRLQKFFPASYAGGVDMLRAFAGPLPMLRFCPTGGITAGTAAKWLAAPNVLCVGGSWLSAPALVRAARWSEIEQLAREAAALR